MYRFIIPVGDWSDDGHGRCDDYTVESNKDVQAMREALFVVGETTGFLDLFTNYEADKIDAETYHDLIDYAPEAGPLFEPVGGGEYALTDCTYGYVKLLILLAQKADPSLEVVVIDDELPSLVFSGYDEQGRHLRYGGYGLHH